MLTKWVGWAYYTKYRADDRVLFVDYAGGVFLASGYRYETG
jgi:hypothetical protein